MCNCRCQAHSRLHQFPPSAVDPPVTKGQPVPLMLIVPGQSATFTVTATGVNLMYQWQKDGRDISGATSATYTIAVVAESDEGEYQCVVSNTAGFVTSTAANLTLCKLSVSVYMPIMPCIIILKRFSDNELFCGNFKLSSILHYILSLKMLWFTFFTEVFVANNDSSNHAACNILVCIPFLMNKVWSAMFTLAVCTALLIFCACFP